MTTPWLVRARRRVGSALMDGFFRGASQLGTLHPRVRPRRHGVVVSRNQRYRDGDEPAHVLDIWTPTRETDGPASRAAPLPPARAARRGPDGRLPVVLYCHGGGFRILSKETHWLPALMFARDGWLCVNINYRLAPTHPFPAAIEDVCAAWTWVVQHADALGADLSRVVFAGESAGANLATALTIATCSPRPEPWAADVYRLGVRPRAVLPAMGILQVSDYQRFRRAQPHLRPFLADRIRECSTGYLPDGVGHPLADPLVALESDLGLAHPFPPTWSAGGLRDPIVDDTRRLEAALARRGVQHQVTYWPDGFHAFHMFVNRPDARQVWADMLAFADQHAG